MKTNLDTAKRLAAMWGIRLTDEDLIKNFKKGNSFFAWIKRANDSKLEVKP